jgi:hypothetical protein
VHISLLDYVQAAIEFVGREVELTCEDPPGAPVTNHYSCRQLEEDHGIVPRVPLTQGIAEILARLERDGSAEAGALGSRSRSSGAPVSWAGASLGAWRRGRRTSGPNSAASTALPCQRGAPAPATSASGRGMQWTLPSWSPCSTAAGRSGSGPRCSAGRPA